MAGPQCQVEYRSSEEGRLLSSTYIEANGTNLVIPLSEIRTELALKIKPCKLKPMHADSANPPISIPGGFTEQKKI